MYNLIVSGSRGAWDATEFQLDQSRFLEHTEEKLKSSLPINQGTLFDRLMRLPTLFAYERGVNGLARVGWITKIAMNQKTIRLAFKFDRAVPSIETEFIEKNSWDFDVNHFELFRTHWAIKDIDLFDALSETGHISKIARNPGDPVPPYADGTPVEALAIEPIEIQPTAFRKPETPRNEKLVAIMMPFESKYDAVHNSILSACLKAGLTGRRVDNMWEAETIIQDVFTLIWRARIVVVDFTGRNPNVFYEAGIAHTLGRHVVPITQSDSDVPFDLKHHRYLRYLSNNQGLAELAEKLGDRLSTLAGR